MSIAISSVSKESITSLKFSQNEVLTDSASIDARNQQLAKACELGNSYKGKVRIIFQTTDGTKEVQTTIWGVTGESISLKNGVWIPIKSIMSVLI